MDEAGIPQIICRQMMERFGVARRDVRFVFSPYRICPLGAHIDHQLGCVTAMALDRGTWLGFAAVDRRGVELRSLDFDGEVAIDFDAVPERPVGNWGDYARGAIAALQHHHRIQRGLVGITAGRMAEGGLSSSASVSVAYLLALEHVNRFSVPAAENIALVQRIENDYLGLRIGILDQSAILLSRGGYLTLIDCADLRHESIAPGTLMPSFKILIASSGLRKSLVGTAYNQRVAECAEAARTLLAAAGHPSDRPVLRSVSAEQYHMHRDRLSGPPALRAAHFFTEMDRVQRGVDAWRRGDLEEFGRQITQSGASSINQYECGAPPLVDLYHLLIETEGVYGARFSGAGFRGCCLALVAAEHAEEARQYVLGQYGKKHPALAEQAWTILCDGGDGARVMPAN